MPSFSSYMKGAFTRPEKQIPALDALRAIPGVWLLAFHTIWFIPFFFDEAVQRTIKQSFFYDVFVMGAYGVDTFFVLSGFLICHILLKEAQSTGGLNLPNFYARRLWRLWPAYMVTLVLYCQTVEINCQNSWANLLYVNNFLPLEEQCMAWGWSLAIEEQFYILFPLVLLGLLALKGPNKPLWVLLGLFLLALLIRYALLESRPEAINSVVFHPLFDKASFNWYFDTLYDKPWSRFGSLILGVLVAFLYGHNLVWQRFILHRYAGFALPALMIICFGYALSGISTDLDLQDTGDFIKAMVSQYVFALGVAAFILYALREIDLGQNRLWFMKQRFWYVLAQLSYSVYLLHPIVICGIYRSLSRQKDVVLDASMLMAVFFLALAITLFLAFLMYVFVERPCMNYARRYSTRLVYGKA